MTGQVFAGLFHYPADPFTLQELLNPTISVSDELHKTAGSTDFEALKSQKGRSGSCNQESLGQSIIKRV